MLQYRYCHLILHSSIPLPELLTVDREDPQPESAIRIRQCRKLRRVPDKWGHQWRDAQGYPSILHARDQGYHFLRFRGLADFLISDTCDSIQFQVHDGCARDTLHHLLLDQVLPRVLGHRGHLVLHASAVRTPFGAVGFLGSSGSGKSTLAASLVVAGAGLLADDCLLLQPNRDQVACVPSYPGLRLWPDSAAGVFEPRPDCSAIANESAKKRYRIDFRPTSDEVSPHRLARLYVLVPRAPPPHDESITIQRASKRYAFLQLVKESFHLDVTCRQRHRVTFGAIDQFIGRVPVFTLSFPCDHACLPAVRGEILSHLKGPAPGTLGLASAKRR